MSKVLTFKHHGMYLADDSDTRVLTVYERDNGEVVRNASIMFDKKYKRFILFRPSEENPEDYAINRAELGLCAPYAKSWIPYYYSPKMSDELLLETIKSGEDTPNTCIRAELEDIIFFRAFDLAHNIQEYKYQSKIYDGIITAYIKSVLDIIACPFIEKGTLPKAFSVAGVFGFADKNGIYTYYPETLEGLK